MLTVVTNCFIISGVIHHWRPRAKPIYNYTNEYTQLAKTLEEATQIQKKPRMVQAARKRTKMLIKNYIHNHDETFTATIVPIQTAANISA